MIIHNSHSPGAERWRSLQSGKSVLRTTVLRAVDVNLENTGCCLLRWLYRGIRTVLRSKHLQSIREKTLFDEGIIGVLHQPTYRDKVPQPNSSETKCMCIQLASCRALVWPIRAYKRVKRVSLASPISLSSSRVSDPLVSSLCATASGTTGRHARGQSCWWTWRGRTRWAT